MPIDLDPAAFDAMVGRALDGLPDELAQLVDNLVVLVEPDAPDDDPDLLGLYDGLALTERPANHAGMLPDRILLFHDPATGAKRWELRHTDRDQFVLHEDVLVRLADATRALEGYDLARGRRLWTVPAGADRPDYASINMNEPGTEALADLLTRDATLEMPPFAAWFAGRDHVVRFAAAHILGAPGDLRLFPVSANGRPAAASYMRGPDGVHRAHCVQVLTVSDGGVSGIAAFLDPGLFPRFGLPTELPCEPPSAAAPGGPVPSGSAAVCTR